MKDTFAILDTLLLIIALLRNPSRMSELTESLNKDERTVYRYLEDMEDMGFLIERAIKNRKRFYRIISIPEAVSSRFASLHLLTKKS